MNVHKNARLTAHSGAELARRVLDGGRSRQAVATAFGVDARTVGKWVGRIGRCHLERGFSLSSPQMSKKRASGRRVTRHLVTPLALS
jgi:transposase-like protein